MKAYTSKGSCTVNSRALFALVHAALGWILLETFLAAAGAGPLPHAVSTASALCLTGVALHRHRDYRKQVGLACGSGCPPRYRLNAGDAAWALLLFGAGALLGSVVLAGRVLPLAAVAAAAILAPWSRAMFYRRHFAASCALVLAGALAVLGAGQRQLDIAALPGASWALWACACLALLRHHD